MPIRADLSTIQETEERSTEAGSSTGIHRTRSREEEFPSAISQITEASGGYEIPVSAQLGVGQVASSLLMLGGLPSHLDELDEEEASYFTPDGDLPPPRFPSSQQQLSYVSASGGGGGTIPDAFEPSSWNGGIMSSPSVTQWLAQGGGGTGTGTGTTLRQIPSETAAPHKRKWLWRGLFILCLLLVTIAGVVVGMLISGGSDDTTPDSSASAATDRGNGVDGGSSEDIEETVLTASPIATPSPSNSPTEARFGMVVLPSFPWEDAISRRPTTAPVSMAPSTMAPSAATTPGETGLDEGPNNPGNGPDIEEVACPVKPQIQDSSGSDGFYIAKYYVGWNAHTLFEDNKYVGECDQNTSVGLTAKCSGQATAVIDSGDICTADGNTVICADNPNSYGWVEIGCISPNTSEMGIEVAVMDGSTICTKKGTNIFVNYVSATCSGAAVPFVCSDSFEGELWDGSAACASWGLCDVDRGVDSCSAYYYGARLKVGSHDECIEDFSTSRNPGELCQWDVECASNVCAAGICREAKGCQDDDCSRNEHCQSNLCLQSSCTSP